MRSRAEHDVASETEEAGMKTRAYDVRRAVPADADAIAALFTASFRLLTFLPMLHSEEEDREFIATMLMPAAEIWVAADASGIVSFVALEGEVVRLLHTRPDRIGTGAGALLIARAQAERPRLRLWCFQANEGARLFYERHGFRAVRFTDGAENDEKMPDMLYEWTG
jgi:putative acetyltransferase